MRRRPFRLPVWLLHLSMFFISIPVAAQGVPASVFTTMPTSEAVIAGIRGSNDLDTAARRVAALDFLSDVVSNLAQKAPKGAWLLPEEQALYARYHRPANAIRGEIYESFGETDRHLYRTGGKKDKWNILTMGYRSDENFKSAILRDFLPEEIVRQFESIRKTRLAEAGARAGDTSVSASGKAAQGAAGGTLPKTGNRAALWDGLRTRLGVSLLVALTPAILLMFLMLPGRAAMDDVEPRVVHLGHTRYELRSKTGRVIGKERMLETRTHVSGGGSTVIGNTVVNNPVTTTHTTIERLHFFIRPESGGEEEISLENTNFSVRDGHIVSVTIAVREGKVKWFPIVLLRNHSTGQDFYSAKNFDKLLKPRGIVINTLKVLLVLSTLPALFLPLIPYAIAAGIVRSRQRGRVIREINARYVPTLDMRAAALA